MTQTVKKPNRNNPRRNDDGRASEARELNQAIRAAFRIYRYRELESNLKAFGWRKARRQGLRNGALSEKWVRRGGSEVRLSRRGLEVLLSGEDRRMVTWQRLWEFVQTRR